MKFKFQFKNKLYKTLKLQSLHGIHIYICMIFFNGFILVFSLSTKFKTPKKSYWYYISWL